MICASIKVSGIGTSAQLGNKALDLQIEIESTISLARLFKLSFLYQILITHQKLLKINFSNSGLGAFKDRFVSRSFHLYVGPYVETKNKKKASPK